MKKFIGITLVVCMGLALVACSSDEGSLETSANESLVETVATVEETQAVLAPIIGGEEIEATAATEGASEAASIPLNQDAYNEFAEPVMYEVVEDCTAWSDNSLQTVSRTVYTGSVVNGVATDGYYLILDNQEVVELSHLQILQ